MPVAQKSSPDGAILIILIKFIMGRISEINRANIVCYAKVRNWINNYICMFNFANKWLQCNLSDALNPIILKEGGPLIPEPPESLSGAIL